MDVNHIPNHCHWCGTLLNQGVWCSATHRRAAQRDKARNKINHKSCRTPDKRIFDERGTARLWATKQNQEVYLCHGHYHLFTPGGHTTRQRVAYKSRLHRKNFLTHRMAVV